MVEAFGSSIEAVQVLAAAVAGFVAGRGRVGRALTEERAARRALEVDLASARRELAFTNALVVELVRNHGITTEVKSK